MLSCVSAPFPARKDYPKTPASNGPVFSRQSRQRARYIVSHGFLKKGEIADISVRHLDVDVELTTRELAERAMVECNLDVSDTALRNLVVLKLVQALRHAKLRKLVRMIEKKKGMCVWGDAVTLRVVPITLPRPVDRGRERAADQEIRQVTIAPLPMILEPGCMGRVCVEIFPFDFQMLSANQTCINI